MIIHAVTEGMRSFLMKGKNPSGLIHLTIPPTEVDVNVHPAKHEVRFRNTREVHELINQCVAKAMRDQQAAMKMVLFSGDRRSDTTAIPLDSDRAEELPLAMTAPSSPGTVRREDIPLRPVAPPSAIPIASSSRSTRACQPQSLLATAEPLPKTSFQRDKDMASEVAKRPEPQSPTHNLLVIGQFDDLYIFCRNSQGLLVIDQHAAHERLLYEKLRRQYLAASIARQILMFPVTVELSLFQSQLIEKFGEDLDRMGFSIRDFGGNTFIISAIPALAGTTNPRDLFLDILEQFGSESSGSDRGGSLDTVLATMACKAAVKAGTSLSPLEIDKLLSEMAQADLFSHCPHGRPVAKQFTREEMKRWFYRS
jgi:DNA mismatch repair protein MutL